MTFQVELVSPEAISYSGDTIAVHQGFVQVAGTKVSILSDVSESAADIDVARAEAARLNAEEALSRDRDDEEAAAALSRAELRLRVATSS